MDYVAFICISSRCSSFSGFILLHSMSGGTGSGEHKILKLVHFWIFVFKDTLLSANVQNKVYIYFNYTVYQRLLLFTSYVIVMQE